MLGASSPLHYNPPFQTRARQNRQDYPSHAKFLFINYDTPATSSNKNENMSPTEVIYPTISLISRASKAIRGTDFYNGNYLRNGGVTLEAPQEPLGKRYNKDLQIQASNI